MTQPLPSSQSEPANSSGQTVNGPQTNIAGDATAPVLSGQFTAPTQAGDIQAETVSGDGNAIGPGATVTNNTYVFQQCGRALGALLAAPEAREAAIVFHTRTAMVSEQIHTLHDHKRLHDLLHKIEFECFKPLAHLHWNPAALNDLDSQDTLSASAATLEQVIASGRAVTRIKNVNRLKWLDKASQALAALQTTLDKAADLQVEEATTSFNTFYATLKRVLDTEPSCINSDLVAIANQVQLSALHTALVEVNAQLRGLDLNTKLLEEFESGLPQLAQLTDQLNALVRAHGEWQTLTNECNLIGAQLTANLDELLNAWPELHELLQNVSPPHPAHWAKAIADLEAALSGADERMTRGRLAQLTRQMGVHFSFVDDKLKETCNALSQVDDTLDNVLKGMAV